MRYILGVIAVIIIAFLAIASIVNRTGNDGTTPPSAKTTHLSELAADDTELILTTRGRLTGDDTFRSVRITINATSRKVEILDGYNLVVSNSKTFSNNETAFTNLLFALDNAGYLRSQKSQYSDLRGVCPNGQQFTYAYTSGDDKPDALWSTSCGVSNGTLRGSAALIRQIMQNQITDYNTFISGVRL